MNTQSFLLFIGLFVVIIAISGTAAAEDPSDSGAVCSDSSTVSGTSSTDSSSSASAVASGSAFSGISVTSNDSDATSGSDSTAEVASADTSDSDANTVPAQQSETTSTTSENADTQDNLKIDTTNPEETTEDVSKIPDPRNTRTNESFTTIQGAIDDPDTMDGDEIMVEAGTYTENVIVNKNLTIKPVSGDNVIVHAADPNIPVFTITSAGSGSTIQGFTISGATNSYGVYLDSADNCTINNNIITENLYGIYLYNSSNNTVAGNTVTDNERGIYIPAECISWEEYADYYDLYQYLGDPELEPIWWDEYWSYQTHYSGISSTSLNNSISGNNINNNNYGIYLQSDGYSEPDGNDNHIIGNNIVSNDYGVYVCNSAGNVHFNRITGNNFGIFTNKGWINATDNWWGSNNPELVVEPSWSWNDPNYVAEPSDIYITREYYQGSWSDSWPSGEVNYNPWIVLNVNATPNQIHNFGTSTIIADLTHNSNNEDTSNQSHVPDGIPVTFIANIPNMANNTLRSSTLNGRALARLSANTNTEMGTLVINATVDSQQNSTQITKTNSIMSQTATIAVYSSAYDPDNYDYICQQAYNTGFGEDLEVWYVMVAEPKMYLWGDINDIYPNLQFTEDIQLNDPVTWVSVIFKQYGILEGQMDILVNGQVIATKNYFNQYNSYYNEYYRSHPIPGWANLENEMHVSLYYNGSNISKTESITYFDGPDAGFECIQSFAIAQSEVTDDLVQYWLDKSSQYPVGYMKAAYGTFMTALTTLWLSDKLADEMVRQLNVTWSRTTPTVVMSGVSEGMAYIHCPDPAMGMNIQGDTQNVKFFRLVCSLLLSEVENAVLSGTGLPVNSTFSTIMSAIMAGKHFRMIGENKTVTIILEEDPSFRLIIDFETCLVKEITEIDGFLCKGVWSTGSAYCYHDQLSNHLPEFISDVKQNAEEFFNQLGVGWIGDHYGEIFHGFELIVTGASIIVTKLSVIASITWMFEMGNDMIYFRDNYLPSDFWLKVSYHDIWNNDVYWYVDPNDHQMHYTEVPK